MNWFKRQPRWRKIILSIGGVLFILMVVGIIGAALSEGDSESAPASPASTEAPSTEAPETPEAPAEPRSVTCPDEWDHAGKTFTYNPANTNRPTAIRANCGTLAPITEVCAPEYDNPGVEFTFDPDVTPRKQALATNCGTLAPTTGVCPSGYENAGLEYEYDPDQTPPSQARRQSCGREFEYGTWVTGIDRDDVDRSSITHYAFNTGDWLREPELTTIEYPMIFLYCNSNHGLTISVFMGGYIGSTGSSIPVEYSFDGLQVSERRWEVLPLQGHPSAGARVPRNGRREVVDAFRKNPTSEFAIRMRSYDGSVHGTAIFDLTGIELQVEPVFQACEW